MAASSNRDIKKYSNTEFKSRGRYRRPGFFKHGSTIITTDEASCEVTVIKYITRRKLGSSTNNDTKVVYSTFDSTDPKAPTSHVVLKGSHALSMESFLRNWGLLNQKDEPAVDLSCSRSLDEIESVKYPFGRGRKRERLARFVSRRARSEEGQDTGSLFTSASRMPGSTHLAPSWSARPNVLLELSKPVPTIVVCEPEKTPLVGPSSGNWPDRVACMQQRQGIHRAITEPSDISSGWLETRVANLNITDELEQTDMPASGRTDTEVCGGEILSVPDVEFSDESDSEEGYWEWDQEEEQFRHLDEATQTWVYCPDEFD